MEQDDKPTSRADAPTVSPILLTAAIVAPGLVVFAFPMVSLIARNGEYFAGAYGAGRTLYVAAALLVLVGALLFVVRRSRAGQFAFLCYLLITPAWVIYTIANSWHRAASLVLLAVAIGLVAGAIIHVGAPRAVGTIAMLSTIILVATGLSTGLETRAETSSAAPAAGSGAGGGDAEAGAGGDDVTGPAATAPPIEARPSGEQLPNVYHLVLDEFQTEQFQAAADDADREALRGFTFYEDAVTPYGRTELSIADMFSSHDYAYDTPPADFIQQALLGPESGVQQLRAAGYDTTAYVHSRDLYGHATPFDQLHLSADAAASNPGANYADLANSMWVHANAPEPVAKRLLPQRHYEQLTTGALLPDDAPALSVEAFETFVNREQEQAATGRYTLVHLIIPHKPYVLGADCTYEPGVDTGAAEQAGCALALVDELIVELQELGRFDSSTIIIQGDHGAGLALKDGKVSAMKADFYSTEWSAARSRPLLLVKPAGTGADQPLVTSDIPAELTDIVPTIFDSVDLPLVSDPARVSLLSPDFPSRPVRYYHFYEQTAADLPDGSVTRYAIDEDGEVGAGEVIPVP